MLSIYRKTGNKTTIDILNGQVDDSEIILPTKFIEDLKDKFGSDIDEIWFLEIHPWIYHMSLRLDQIHKVNRCRLANATIYGVRERVDLILSVIEYVEKNYEIVKT